MTRTTSLIALALCTTCLRPTDERAERDLEVGKAQSPSLRVDVQQGLAAIRALDSEQLLVWGSAPAFALDLEHLTTVSKFWTIEAWNVLPDAELTAELPLEITELESDIPTRKRFRVNLPAGRTRLTLSPRTANERSAFRFALLSDVQEAIDRVSDVFQRINAEPDIRFLLGAGDLTRRGTLAELEQFQNELIALKIPYFTTLGNHELGVDPPLYHEWFGRGSFQFQFQHVTFTMLDSASAMLDPLVYDWLDGWLARAKHTVHVVAMHIPPLDPCGVRNGAFASRAEAAKLLGRLAEARVDLTLYGHVHSYYAFENAGIPAFISGGGGAIPERFDRIGRHFMVVDASPDLGIVDTRVVRVD